MSGSKTVKFMNIFSLESFLLYSTCTQKKLEEITEHYAHQDYYKI